MLWADFGSTTLLDPVTAFQVANLYAIVSVEKCFGQQAGLYTEDAFLATAAQLKSFNPAVKVLFYFHAIVDISGPNFPPCYRAGEDFLANPTLWLYGDDGNPLMNGPFLQHNLTLAQTARYMVDTVTGVQAANYSLFDGIFADGTLASPYANMSQARNDALNAAVNTVTLSESLAVNAAAEAAGIFTGVQVIGNGLAEYHSANPGFPADDGLGMVPFMDGVCVEHFGAFETTDPTNCSLVPALMAELLDDIAVVAAQNKTVLIKGWPGPVSLPIDSLGPTWPTSCNAGDGGDTHIERAQNALEWFVPGYSLFLLAVEPTVYWSYSWWYSVNDGYYPPANASVANQTSAPSGWYPLLNNTLGAPLGPAARIGGASGWVYQRIFEHANVTVDLADYRSASIVWE